MNNEQQARIRMLFKRLLGMESERERQESDAWLREHPQGRRWLDSMEGGREYLRRREFLGSLDTEQELRSVMRGRREMLRKRRERWSAAASVCLIVGAGVFFFSQERESPSVRESGAPGSFGAVLVASDGSRHDLFASGDTIEVLSEHYIVSDSGGITYTGLPAVEEERLEYNRVVVSRGHEYMLTLQDGTKVWLNSDSELEYPVTFVRGERRVRLSGEAYFEVARDSLSPFTVEVDGGFHVRVLGTCFNVKAYETDSRYETTLVSGCVRVEDTTGLEVTLRPSEQLVLGRDGSHEVREVDTRYYLAWHEGWFYFRNESLRQVLLMVGRWYDVEFECGEGVSVDDRQVTGKVRRFDNLKEILGMLSKVTGVEFKEEGDRIVLYDSK